MGDTISTLVFRPPRPTPIKLNKFFYIRIPNVEQKKEFNCSSTSCGGMAPPEMDIFPEKGRLNLNRGQNGNGNGANRMKDDMSIMSSLSGSNSNEEYKIPAFFLRRKGAKATILFSHGNAEDLGMMYRRMKEMAMLLCANVLAYDYTGYGLSTPSNIPPSEEMCYRNIEAAYNHLTKTMRIPPSEIILYGRSLGSGPSCYLAKKTADDGESVAGLILHSPFLSIYRIVIDCRVNLVGDMFINRSKAKDIRCPVLIIHGTKDDVVPFWHGDELLRSFPPQCRAQPFWVHGLGHNHIEIKRKEEYVKRITSFIDMYVVSRNRGIGNTNGSTNGTNGTSSHTTKTLPVDIPEEEQYKPAQTLQESGKFLVNQTWMRHGLAIVNEAMQEKKKKPATTVINGNGNNINNTFDRSKYEKAKAAATKMNASVVPTKQIQQQQQPINNNGNDNGNINKKPNPSKETKTKTNKTVNVKPIRLKQMSTSSKTDEILQKANQRSERDKSERSSEHEFEYEYEYSYKQLSKAKMNLDSMSTKTSTNQFSSQISHCDSIRSVESAASRYLLTKESWGTDDEGEDVSFDDELKENLNLNSVSLQTFSVGNLSGFSLESSFIHDACELSLRKDGDKDNNNDGKDNVKNIDEIISDELDEQTNAPLDRYSVEDLLTAP